MKTKSTMQALFIDEPNGAFITREIEMPTPGPGELLVKITASGVNPLDIKIRQGKAPHARHAFPAILGLDMSGTVVQVGENVNDFKPGDDVFGMVGGVGNIQGTLAEYAIVDANLIAQKPVNMTFREAAALPLIFITAWEGLIDRGRIRRDDKILIHGGAGGVGHVAIQLARAYGAEVFATVSTLDMDIPVQYDAVPINYESKTVEDYVLEYTNNAGFDVIFDTVGGPTLDKSFEAVRSYGGHVISCLGWGTHSLAPLSFKSASYSGVFTLSPLLTEIGRVHHGEILKKAAHLYEAGQLKVRVDTSLFSISEVDSAYELISNKKNAGRIVISLDCE